MANAKAVREKAPGRIKEGENIHDVLRDSTEIVHRDEHNVANSRKSIDSKTSNIYIIKEYTSLPYRPLLLQCIN